MSTLSDSRITESSSLAFSRIWPDCLYTANDEDGKLFVVRPSTGATLSTFRLKDRTLIDPESLFVDFAGALWVGDIGWNSPGDRSHIDVYSLGEPGPNSKGEKACTRYKLQYPGGAYKNAESFFALPDGRKFIITKAATGRLYQLPSTLRTGAMNTLIDTGINMPTDVTDASVTPDGKWLVLTREGQTTTFYIHSTTTWAQVATVTMPSTPDPEGITVDAGGYSVWISSEGVHTALNNVALPGPYCPAGATAYPPDVPTVGGDPVVSAPAAPVPPSNPCGA